MRAGALVAELSREAAPGIVAPAYNGRSIANLLPTILRALGAEVPSRLLPALRDAPPGLFEGVERVVLLTLDGWGWTQFQRGLEGGWARLAQRATAVQPLTTVSPSTTTAAFASLNTGLAPAQHGLLGYHLWLQEFGCVANLVAYAPAVGGRGFDHQVRPEDFFDAPTAGPLLAQAGFRYGNVTRREFLGSALTRMLYKGSEGIGTTTLGELLVEVRHGLRAMKGQKGLLQGYWPSLDTVAHARGPGSEHHAAELALVGEALAREFVDKVEDPQALLLVTADHGLVHVAPEDVLRVRDHPALTDALLLPPWGDSRWAFLQSRESRCEELRAALLDRLPGGQVLRTEEAERLGLLGPQPWHPRTRGRLGDLVALPAPGRAITWPFRWDLPGKPPKEDLLGRHGGTTAEEMLVPLLAVRF